MQAIPVAGEVEQSYPEIFHTVSHATQGDKLTNAVKAIFKFYLEPTDLSLKGLGDHASSVSRFINYASMQCDFKRQLDGMGELRISRADLYKALGIPTGLLSRMNSIIAQTSGVANY